MAYFALLVDIPIVLHRTIFYAFQTRDLTRAADLLLGTPIFYGPEMTGGGNLPGPFYYFLLLPSMLFGANWENAWAEMMVLAAASGTLAWIYFRSKGLPLVGLLACSFVAGAAFTQHFLTIFINPSYQFIVLVPVLILICRAFDPEAQPATRSRSFIGAALLIGLGIQIHYSIIALFPAMLTLQIFAKRLGAPQVKAKILWIAAATLIVPTVPYLVWLLLLNQNVQLGQASNYVGHSSNSLPMLAFLFNAISAINPWDIALIIKRQLQVNTPPTLYLIALSLMVSHSAAKWVKNPGLMADDENLKMRGRALTRPLWVCAAFGFIPFSYVFIVPIANRYGLTMMISLVLLAAVLQGCALSSKFKQYTFNTLALLTAAALGLTVVESPEVSSSDLAHMGAAVGAAALVIFITFINNPKLPTAKIFGFVLSVALVLLHREQCRLGEFRMYKSNMVRYEHWHSVWSDIYQQTGWPVEKLKTRIYFINAHIDGDPEPMYRTVMQERGPVTQSNNAPDGFFVFVKPPGTDRDFRKWILEQPINDEVRGGIENGLIRLSVTSQEGAWAVAYHVDPKANLPKHFHNWGLFYNKSTDRERLSGQAANTAKKIADNKFLFKWNECPDQHPYCDNGAFVNMSSKGDGRLEVSVEVIGESLSQNSPWIHPTWTQSWNNPYVEINCGKKREILNLAANIGYQRKFMFYQEITTYFIANNSMLAPFERTFQLRCDQPVSSVSVGREASTVDRIQDSFVLPAQKLTVKL